MGANISSTINKVDNKMIATAINETLNKFTSKTENRNKITQTRNLNLANAKIDLQNCNFSATQRASIETELVAEMDAQAQTTATNEATNDVMAKLNEELEQTNEGLNLFQKNISTTEMNTRNQFEAELKNVINNTISSVVSSTNDVLQSDNINASGVVFYCRDGNINFDQVATIKSKIDSQNDFTSENSALNQAKNDLIATLETKKLQSNVGLNPFIILIIVLAMIGASIAIAVIKRRKSHISSAGNKWALIIIGSLLMLAGIALIVVSQKSFDESDIEVEPFDIDKLRPIAYINGGLITHAQMKTLIPGQVLSSAFRQSGYSDENKPIVISPSVPELGKMNAIQRVDGINGRKSTNWYIPQAPALGEEPLPVILVGDKIDAIRKDYTGEPLPFIGPKKSIPMMGGGIACLFTGFSMLSFLAYGGRQSTLLGRGIGKASGATKR
jgi:hypothetical protein